MLVSLGTADTTLNRVCAPRVLRMKERYKATTLDRTRNCSERQSACIYFPSILRVIRTWSSVRPASGPSAANLEVLLGGGTVEAERMRMALTSRIRLTGAATLWEMRRVAISAFICGCQRRRWIREEDAVWWRGSLRSRSWLRGRNLLKRSLLSPNLQRCYTSAPYYCQSLRTELNAIVLAGRSDESRPSVC